MTSVRIYDPALCCSTGVCGVSVDAELIRFAADLAWLETQGVAVKRFNLAQQPGAFAADLDVKRALVTLGEAALPLVMVDGIIKCSGTYPSRAVLAAWAGVEVPTSRIRPKAGACCGGAAAGDAAADEKSGCC